MWIPPSSWDDRTDSPLGVRLHNPGCIRLGVDGWQGQCNRESHSGFVAFRRPAYGVRAMFFCLDTYSRLHDVHTTYDVIARWSPTEDGNPVDDYVEFVCKHAGCKAKSSWTSGADRRSRSVHRVPLVLAISAFENAGWLPDAAEILMALRRC